MKNLKELKNKELAFDSIEELNKELFNPNSFTRSVVIGEFNPYQNVNVFFNYLGKETHASSFHYYCNNCKAYISNSFLKKSEYNPYTPIKKDTLTCTVCDNVLVTFIREPGKRLETIIH